MDGNIRQLTLFEGYDLNIPYKNLQATSATVFRTIQANKWATLSLPFALTKPDGWEVRELVSVDRNDGIYTLNFSEAGTIDPGKPYMVRTSLPVTSITAEEVEVLSEAAATNVDDVSMIASFAPGSVPAGDYFISNNAFQLAADNTNTINAFHAYFHIDGGSNVKALLANYNGNANGITLQTVNSKSSNNKWFDLAGRRRSTPQRGINIVCRPDGTVQKLIVP